MAKLKPNRPQDLLWDGSDRGTSGTGITQPPITSRTRSIALSRTEDFIELRNRVGQLSAEIGEKHQDSYEHEWQVLTQQRVTSRPTKLLSDLADLGFSWRDIARMVGVSVPAVQKWRRGENVTGPNRHKLARLLAACDFIVAHFHAEDVGQWFETPIVNSAPTTPIDIWADQKELLVLEYATQALTPEQTMDSFRQNWREQFRSNWETFEAEDGNLSIRAKKS